MPNLRMRLTSTAQVVNRDHRFVSSSHDPLQSCRLPLAIISSLVFILLRISKANANTATSETIDGHPTLYRRKNGEINAFYWNDSFRPLEPSYKRHPRLSIRAAFFEAIS